MNVVREINKINERELDLGLTASWHDDYKDSAYIFVGGLHNDLTEGDVITIFSQYGEIMDVNMPRHKDTGKQKGFAFVMYEDQRSTILAVDNLNGATVLERTLRVDHVRDYKQPKVKTEEGWEDRDEQSLNAKPEMIVDEGAASDSSESSGPDIDPEDPMRDYLLEKYREEKARKEAKKSKSKHKHKDETPEERRLRKEKKKEKKRRKLGKSDGMKGVEELLNELEGRTGPSRRQRSPSPRSRSPTPGTPPHRRRSPGRRDYDSRSRTPPRRGESSRRPRSRSRSPRRDEYHDRPNRGSVDDRRRERNYERDTPPRRR